MSNTHKSKYDKILYHEYLDLKTNFSCKFQIVALCIEERLLRKYVVNKIPKSKYFLKRLKCATRVLIILFSVLIRLSVVLPHPGLEKQE